MIAERTLEEIEELRSTYEQQGYVEIKNFFDNEFAEKLLKSFLQEQNWNIATLVQGRPFIVSVDELMKQEPEKVHSFINEAVLYAAQHPFQYFYEHIRLQGDNDQHGGEQVKSRYAELIKLIDSDKMLEIIKSITGEVNAKEVIEAQLTKYTANYFLKSHTDSDPNNPYVRHAALVFGFSKDWIADWGGVLNLKKANTNEYAALLPGFNCLQIFKVPTEHFVSQVANYCPKPRIAISGWIASKK